MPDFDCECGNTGCHNSIMVRKGHLYNRAGVKIKPLLHMDVCDMEGTSLEIFLTPKEARRMMRAIMRFFIFRRKNYRAR